MSEKIVTAAVLVIGDEILSGRTKDRNIGYIAEYLANIGVDLREARVEQIQVRAKTLLTLAREEGYSKIDAIKLDIEGAEDLVLDPFLNTAPRDLWPRLIVMEFALLRVGAQLEARLRRLGYREILRTGENVAYELVEEAPD